MTKDQMIVIARAAPVLFEPEKNCEQGTIKLARCLQRAHGDIREALLHYNGGGNTAYPDLVLAHLAEYQK